MIYGKKARGKIIEPSGCNVRDHERATARALSDSGLTVEFIPPDNSKFKKSPDVIIGKYQWEMKSPKTDKLNQIQNNLKKANRQSPYIIIDSQRIKRLSDTAVQNYLLNRAKSQHSIKKLIFINCRREVIDIKI